MGMEKTEHRGNRKYLQCNKVVIGIKGCIGLCWLINTEGILS